MIKILHIGCNAGTESMPKYFREQCDYSELKLDSRLVINLEKIDRIPDIIFLQIQSDKIEGQDTVSFLGETMSSFKKRGSFIINWTGDKRNGVPNWMYQFSKFVSITGFSNQEDVDDFNRNSSNKAVFLQQGIDINIFNDSGEPAKTPDIVFLANNYGNQFPLSKYRRDIVNSLRAKYGNNFEVYGNGWGSNAKNVNHSQYEEAKVYRGCKIAISCSHFDSDRYFSDRLGRALCSGAFVLSHDYKGIEKDFVEGKHLDTFKNVQDLIIKCDEWLNKPVERMEISELGRKHASKEFSYQNIIKQICNLKP